MVEGAPGVLLDFLRGHGITTGEELLEAMSQSRGLEVEAERQLPLGGEQLRELNRAVREAIGEEAAEALRKPATRRATGAVKP